MNKLLPCPVCGSTDIKMYAFDIAPECSVECQKCGTCVCGTVSWRKFDTVKSHDKRCWKALIKKWNRRASTEKECVTRVTDKDYEIIEAIERCATGSADDCNLCEFQGGACRAGIISQIFNLINRYKLENEKQRKTENDADETIKAQAAEIDRLQKLVVDLNANINQSFKKMDFLKSKLAFAEQCISQVYMANGLHYGEKAIDKRIEDYKKSVNNLIKEMTEKGDSK